MNGIGSTGANLEATFHLVRDELTSTVESAEASFARFVENQMSDSELQKSIDELNQARGTFKMIEVKGASLLLEEMLALANEMLGQNVADDDKRISVFSHALFTLARYLEYLEVKRQELPVLLLPIINDLRGARKQRPLPDAYFFTANLRPQLPETGAGDSAALLSNLRRIRHMYQLGLLGVLKGDNEQAGIKVMSRAIYHLEKGSRQSIAWSFWWVARAALESAVDNKYVMNVGRKRLFAQVDRLLRKLLVVGQAEFAEKQPDGLLKDLLMLVSLAEEQSVIVQQVQKVYHLSGGISEQVLRKEIDTLNGPNTAAIKSVAAALQDEVTSIKEVLDLASRAEGAESNFDSMNASIVKVADTLSMIGQAAMAEPVKALVPVVEAWSGKTEVLPEDFLQVADVMLQLESKISNMVKMGNDDVETEVVGANHLVEARIVLVSESESGLALAKRAIASYMESGYDKMHLGNISKTLDAVRGGLIFLGEERACALITCGLQFIGDKLVHASEPPQEAELEVLADALSSVEYYLETMAGSKELASEVLDVAAASMAQLGYKV